jgi:phosphonate transport system substrate-binding protein
MAEGRPFSIYAVAAGAIFATAAAVLWARINPEAPPQFIDLNAVPAATPVTAQGAVRFAVASVWAPERTAERHYDLARHVAHEIRRPLRIVQRRTYGEVNELLRHEGVDAAIICTGAYLEALRDGIALTVIAVPVNTEGPVYHSVFVVPTNSPLRTIEDLEGHSFALSDPLSLSGNYYPLSVVLDRGKDPRTFFTRTMYTYGEHGSLRAVLDGIVDAAAVDSLAYDFDGPRQELREIHRSPPLGISPVVVPRSTPPQLVASLRRAFLAMHQNAEGREILEALHLLRFEAPPPGLYDEAARVVDVVLRHGTPSE